MRFRELMADVFHCLGMSNIEGLVWMSDIKYSPIINSGIKIVEQVPIRDQLVPEDVPVEIAAKKATAYDTNKEVPDENIF